MPLHDGVSRDPRLRPLATVHQPSHVRSPSPLKTLFVRPEELDRRRLPVMSKRERVHHPTGMLIVCGKRLNKESGNLGVGLIPWLPMSAQPATDRGTIK